MKVKDVMTPSPRTCHLDTDLSEAAKLMWDGDFGVVPVVTEDGRVVSMITDRDICMAAATQQRAIQEILVAQVVEQGVHTCRAEDDVESAAVIMKEQKVRRLPVVDAEGRLTGVLSLNDLLRKSRKSANSRDKAVSPDVVLAACQEVSEHRKVAERRPSLRKKQAKE